MAQKIKKGGSSPYTVLDPRGQPTNVVRPLPCAPRLDTLEGKTLCVVDVGFGGGWEFLEETVAWFARNRPGGSWERTIDHCASVHRQPAPIASGQYKDGF